ncbi:hypothetical protein HYH03_018648 [Edaphochlamys debaryana]|uniref:Uncharacterized protein n=1 Tax=Edaphochlamys debaryana TaxID=47281 RepID=A0A836BPA5_9CHLO|nr:hypothetical protein HYH03_018648 [Edaphochlamys debaryana]|eukprot:KAG2482413.1 hypothetical protein HYH03_018648 [Edaphochlamys debaryana]
MSARQRVVGLVSYGPLFRTVAGGGAAAAWAPPPGALTGIQAVQGTRSMGTALADVPPAVIAKARRLAVAVGAFAGVFGSFVGVGGGVIISPIIANACKAIPQRVISGTSLAAVATTGAAAGSVYYASGAVDPTSAAIIAASALATTPLGARATKAFDCASLRRLMAYWLFLVAPLVPLKSYLFKHHAGPAPGPAGAQAQAQAGPQGAAGSAAAGGSAGGTAEAAAGAKAVPGGEAAAEGAKEGQGGGRPVLKWRELRPTDGVLVVTGAVAGFASGLLGIGGGTIVTPLLTLATGLPQLSVLGTSLTAMVVPSLVGLAQHARLGNVDWRMAAGLAAGTFVGSSAGGRVALSLPDWALEWVFVCGMLFLGRKTLAGAGPAKKAAEVVAQAASKPA